MRQVVILYDFNIFYNEMGQHLEDLHNSVNQYFPNDQCIMLTKSCMGKRCIQRAGQMNRF